jgi:hypothetical protein
VRRTPQPQRNSKIPEQQHTTLLVYVAVQSRWLTERFGVTLATGLGLAALGFAKATAIVVIAVAALSAIPG